MSKNYQFVSITHIDRLVCTITRLLCWITRLLYTMSWLTTLTVTSFMSLSLTDIAVHHQDLFPLASAWSRPLFHTLLRVLLPSAYSLSARWKKDFWIIWLSPHRGYSRGGWRYSRGLFSIPRIPPAQTGGIRGIGPLEYRRWGLSHMIPPFFFSGVELSFWLKWSLNLIFS